MILTSTIFPPVTSTIVSLIMPARAIGKTMSMFLLIWGVAGAGLGPLAAALLSDHLYAGVPHGLALALTTAAVIYGTISLVAAVALYFAMRRLSVAELG